MLAGLQAGERLRPFADNFEQYLDQGAFSDLVNGKWPAQQRVQAFPCPYHDKLTWPGACSNIQRFQGKPVYISCKLFGADYFRLLLICGHEYTQRFQGFCQSSAVSHAGNGSRKNIVNIKEINKQVFTS
jgi:hypothetical protein